MHTPLSSRQGCVCFQNFLQSNSHLRLRPVSKVSYLASQKLSPTESREEPSGFLAQAQKSCRGANGLLFCLAPVVGGRLGDPECSVQDAVGAKGRDRD